MAWRPDSQPWAAPSGGARGAAKDQARHILHVEVMASRNNANNFFRTCFRPTLAHILCPLLLYERACGGEGAPCLEYCAACLAVIEGVNGFCRSLQRAMGGGALGGPAMGGFSQGSPLFPAGVPQQHPPGAIPAHLQQQMQQQQQRQGPPGQLPPPHAMQVSRCPRSPHGCNTRLETLVWRLRRCIVFVAFRNETFAVSLACPMPS